MPTTIILKNGFTKKRSQLIIEFEGMEIREGKPEWGAEP